MTLPRRWIALAGGAVIVLVVGYALFRIAASNTPARAAVGLPAPDFNAVTLDSTPRARTLADYRGSPVLLNIWATWCDPCREEMPSMQRLHEAYAARGLRIVAVSIDDRGNEGLIREFAAEHGLTFDILHQGSTDMMATYQVVGVPQTFLISPSGTLVATRFVTDWASAGNRALIDSLFFSPGANRE